MSIPALLPFSARDVGATVAENVARETVCEEILDAIEGESADTRTLVVRRGEVVDLRQQSHATGLGWCTQSTVTLPTAALGRLWPTLRMATTAPKHITPTTRPAAHGLRVVG